MLITSRKLFAVILPVSAVIIGFALYPWAKSHSQSPVDSSAPVSTTPATAAPATVRVALSDAELTLKHESIQVPSSFGPAAAPPSSGRVLGEYEKHDALMLGVNELLQYHPQALCDIVSALDGRIEIVGLISDPSQERKTIDLLFDRGVSSKHLHFFYWPAISMWVQDFGPIFLVGDDGPRVIDATYQFLDREAEDQVPLAFAAKYGLKISHSPLSMEGGNVLSNGKGLCISSSTLIEQNKGRNYDLQMVGAVLQRDFRFQNWSYLPALIGEPTGHVDMYLTLTSPNSVVVGEYDPADDAANAEQLNNAVATLSKVKVGDESLTVTRMPMPSRRDGKWRTYTNVIFANGVLLVPQYPNYCPEHDRKALEIYRKLLPDWKVVGINASELIEKRGSLHCLSRMLPVMPKLVATP